MIVRPEIRGMLFLNAHPLGCAKNTADQIAYVKNQGPIQGSPKRALIIGSSSGYGLASRIVAGFACGASTVGIFYEKEPSVRRTGTPGWYHSLAFVKAANRDSLYAKNINGDAFSEEIKEQTVDAIKKDLGQVDLLIYSVVAPRRLDPVSGKLAKIAIKPINQSYTEKSYNFIHDRFETVTVPPADQEEIAQTIKVLGGEDWELWVRRLDKENLLGQGFTTVAFSYIGSVIAQPIYRRGTIGAAKEHLEKTAKVMNEWLRFKGGHALISVNKALLTPASSIIPTVSLYLVLLTKVLREKGLDENAVQQMNRLFRNSLYSSSPQMPDSLGRIRLDDLEMRQDVQQEVNKLWHQIDDSNFSQMINFKEFKKEFFKLYGFEVPGVDYDSDVDIFTV